MAWGESKVWQRGTLQSDFYRKLLVDAAERPARNSKRRRLVKPDEMPWELSPHGLLKHMVNEQAVRGQLPRHLVRFDQPAALAVPGGPFGCVHQQFPVEITLQRSALPDFTLAPGH